METNKLDLHWTTPEMGLDSAHIIFKSFSSGGIKDLEEKWPIISASCVNPSELDEWIDLLIGDLEQLRKEGHSKFKHAKESN